MNKNIKVLSLEEIGKVYDIIVNLKDDEYLLEKFVDNANQLQIYAKDKSKLNGGEKFIINKNKHSLISKEFTGFNSKTYYLHKDFLETKSLQKTILHEIIALSFIKSAIEYVTLVIDVDKPYLINITFSKEATKELENNSDINKLVETLCNLIENNQDYLISTLQSNHFEFKKVINPDYSMKNELYYYKQEDVNGAIIVKIKDSLVEEYNQTPIQKAIINIKKIIRLNEYEFNLLNNADRDIYNNIEKYLQEYSNLNSDVKFDSVLATFKYVEKIEHKVKDKNISKVISRFKEALNTFKIHYVITPEDYERKSQCEHMRRGHTRTYKSGKTIFIDSYTAGKN